jgi:hypothetical protein
MVTIRTQALALSYYFKKSSHGGKNFGLRISDCGFRNPHSAIRNGLRAKPALRSRPAEAPA